MGEGRGGPVAHSASFAVVLVALLAIGTTLALAGTAKSDVSLAAAGGVIAGLTLLLVVALGWSDGLTALVLTLPLPALANTPSLRLTVAAPATALVVLGWLLRKAATREPLALSAVPRLPLGLLLAAFGIAAVVGTSLSDGLRELVNFGVMMALLVAAADSMARARDRAESLISVLVLVGGACGALAVLEAVGVLPGQFPRWGTPYHRAALGFGQPNALGMALAPLVPLAVYRMSTATTPLARWGAGAAIGTMILGLAATFSRSSWVAVVAGTLVLLPAGQPRRAARLWLRIALTAVVVDVVSGGMLRDTFQRTLADWVLEQRAALMLAGVLMFWANPLAGVGLGGFTAELARFGAEIPELFDYLPTPHNTYVEVAAEAGVLGLTPFLWLLGAMLLRTIRYARRVRTDPATQPADRELRLALAWSVATVLAVGFSDWMFSHGPGQVAVLILALALATSAPGVPPVPPVPPAPAHAPHRA